MSLRWNNVDLFIPNKNKSIDAKYLNLLKKCSGEVASGEIFAIMGPSGGGKTTLLNALFGKIPKGTISSGEILYNNEERDINNWIKVAGFVDQDDVVNEDFTVEETLRFAALLRLDRKKCLKEYENKSFSEIVEIKLKKVINLLKLEKCYANEMVKVSGGERKRVMIGIELISEPDILFLDEPTSGLDAVRALNLINLLKDMAVSEKKIVVVTIHQPSLEIFNSFNSVLFLANGKSIYNGKISEVDDFLLKSNISKKEGITTPELMIKMCYDVEILEEDNNQYNIMDKFLEIETPVSRKNNDLYFNKSFDFYNIWILIYRELVIITKRKWIFTKSQLSIAITYVIFIWINLIYRIFFDTQFKEFDLIELTNLRDPMKVFNIFVKLYFFSFQKSFFPAIMVPIYILQMRVSASTFMKRWGIMKREVAVCSYSITSAYLSLFIFQSLIACTLGGIFNLCLYISFPSFFNWLLIPTNIIMNLIAISIGLFVGAISTKIFTTILLQTFFSVIIWFRYKWMKSLLYYILCLIKGDTISSESLGNYEKLIWIFYLIPSLHHFNLLDSQLIKFTLFTLKDDFFAYLDEIKYINYEIGILKSIESLKEYFLEETNTLKLSLNVLVTFILFFVLGFYLLGLNLNPSIRMKLEKK